MDEEDQIKNVHQLVTGDESVDEMSDNPYAYNAVPYNGKEYNPGPYGDQQGYGGTDLIKGYITSVVRQHE